MNILKNIGLLALAAGSVFQTAAQSQGDPLLFGYQYNYNTSAAIRGMYTVTTAGTSDLLWKDALAYTGSSTNEHAMLSGWERDGKLCGYQSVYPMPDQSYYKYVERDLETGEVSKEVNIDLTGGWTNFFLNAAYCPDDDRIYGYGFNEGRTAFAFKSAPADKPEQAVIIKDVSSVYPGSICYNHETGTFYGVLNERNADNTYTNSLVTIDVNTGESTKVMSLSTGATSDTKCTGALLWVPARQAFLWNFYTMFDGENPCSQLLEINPTKKTLNVVRSFDDEQNFLYFIADGNDPVAAHGAPARIDNFSSTLGTGDTASISFNLPSKYADGSAIANDVNVSYVVYVDGVSKLNGTGLPGAEVKGTLTLSDGTHFIRVVPTVNNVNGLSDINVIYVGDDSPRAPENIVLTEKTLVWDAVTTGLAGNPISDVMYVVEINGMLVAETTDTNFDVEDVIFTDGELTNYRAGVRALYRGRYSKYGYSNDIVVGNPWTVPFTIYPDAEQFSLMIQEDVDKDNVMWTLDKEQYTESYVLTSGFSRYTATDDWIFLPKFTASSDKVYSLEFNVFLADVELGGARVEAWIGDAPSKSAMKKVLVPAIRMLSDNPDAVYTGQFVVDGDLVGKDLYIGIGVSSDAGVMSPLRFKNLSVYESASVSMDGPEAVGNLSASTVAGTEPTTRVSFTLPAKTLAGNAIPASSTVKATVKIDGGRSGEVSGAPGEQVSVDLVSGTGDYMVTVTPSCDGKTGLSSNCVAGLGYGVPGLVRNVKVSYDDTNCAMRIDWDAPDTDLNGNSIEGDQFSYKVWAYNSDSKSYELAVEVPYPLQFATVLMEENTSLQILEVGITAVNMAGESTAMSKVICQIGDPESLPAKEDFNADWLAYPLTIYNSGEYKNAEILWGAPSKLGLSGDLLGADGDVIAGVPSEAGAKSRIDLPKVSTVGVGDPLLILNIWTGDNAATTKIVGTYPSDDFITTEGVTYYPETQIEVATIAAGNGYQSVPVALPAQMANQPWSFVSIISEYPSLASRFVLAGYEVTSGSGVEGVTETVFGTIFGRHGVVTITGYEGKTARVYTLDGAKVAEAVVSGGSCDINLASGIYVVRVADRTEKVVVR